MSNAATSTGLLAVSAGANALPAAMRTSGMSVGRLMGATVAGGSATTTLTIYDNNAGDTTGTVLDIIIVAANTSWVANYEDGVAFTKGLSYVLSGTGGQAVLRYIVG